jgi:signal transduction histidine kinase
MKILHQSHDQLERLVRERTAELAQRNEALTIEIAERLKMEQSLLESKEQLRILASQVLAAQENERKRIALEIHDGLGSALSAIKFKVEEVFLHLPKDNISKFQKALIPFIQDTIEEARRIQADLRPPLLDDLGIVATLSWFCRRFETIYSGIKIEQAVSIREEEVPDHLKIAIFRIIQEALNNISKHAKADSVYLGLGKVGEAIELLIKDNGEGFDPGSLSSREILKKGLGLSSMKERVEFSGGSFSVESAKGKGTVILAVWTV